MRGFLRRAPPRGQARASGSLARTCNTKHVTFGNLEAPSAPSFFAVFDGLGGPAEAKYRVKRFHSNLASAVNRTFFRMDVIFRGRGRGGGCNGQWKKYRKDMWCKRFILCAKQPVYEDPLEDGCTACVALSRVNIIIVGNAGDSCCIISRYDQAMVLSADHEPIVPAQAQSIQNSGHHQATCFPKKGNICHVDNGIAIARAIGDLRYKDNKHVGPAQQAVTAFPDVRTELLADDTEFLFIPCVGIWDCMSSQEVMNFIRAYPNDTQLVAICEALLHHCQAQPRGRDNMTALLVSRGLSNPPPPAAPRHPHSCQFKVWVQPTLLQQWCRRVGLWQ